MHASTHAPLDSKTFEPRSRVWWRALRWFSQSLALFALVFGPFMGAWQRLDRAYLAAWNSEDWELPTFLAANLPHDESTKLVYQINSMIGGGSAASYLSWPIADPIGTVIAWLYSQEFSAYTWLAWFGPVILGIIGGRIFCGWLCPFGTLSRAIEGLLERFPWKAPRYVLPKRRPIRFLVLGMCVIFGAIGSHFVFYASLPYILMQQSVYSMWLLGGGGAVLGAFLGLIAAGLLFGPTTYCATLCPTGAALNLLGRKKAIRLKIIDSRDCGAHCDLCDRGCWLALQPSLGDPGPDCDSCGRCIEVCPADNLNFHPIRLSRNRSFRWQFWKSGPLGTSRSQPKSTPEARIQVRAHVNSKLSSVLSSSSIWQLLPLFAVLVLSSAWSGTWAPTYEIGPSRPKLVFEQFSQLDNNKAIGISVVDLHHVQLDADDTRTIGHTEISLYLAQSEEKRFNELGEILPGSKVYRDKIELELDAAHSECPSTLEIEHPNSPISTPKRSVYRKAIPCILAPGDQIRLSTTSSDWLPHSIAWAIPYTAPGDSWTATLIFLALGFLLYSGLHALALGQRTVVPPLAKT